jgi:nucleoside-diphosphate-sugar epimerase
MQKIAILGCGWLGLSLAKFLGKNNFEVSGSTTSPEKLDSLENAKIKAFLINIFEDKIDGDIHKFLEQANVLIINIPPKLRGLRSENFVTKIKNLIPFIEKASINKVLFVSSTSIFADENLVVNQDTIPNPVSESGQQLWQTEKILQSNINFETTVLRFGGLVGTDRHPAIMLGGRTMLPNPKAPINLIHKEDCINIIFEIIKQNSWGKSYNAVSPYHPSREKYYTQKAELLEVPKLSFDHTKQSYGKMVLSDGLINDLKYKFLIVENI